MGVLTGNDLVAETWVIDDVVPELCSRAESASPGGFFADFFELEQTGVGVFTADAVTFSILAVAGFPEYCPDQVNKLP